MNAQNVIVNKHRNYLPCQGYRQCGTVVSRTCWVLWWYYCQALWWSYCLTETDVLGFVLVLLLVWCVGLCGGTDISLTCRALWQYCCQSDVPGFERYCHQSDVLGFVVVLLSVWSVRFCGGISHVMYKLWRFTWICVKATNFWIPQEFVDAAAEAKEFGQSQPVLVIQGATTNSKLCVNNQLCLSFNMHY